MCVTAPNPTTSPPGERGRRVQRQPEGHRPGHPVDEVHEVVEPRDRVEQVQGVPRRVQEEGEDHEDVDDVRVGPSPPPATRQQPAGRDHRGDQPVACEPRAEGLALELREVG
jgi:hypothetical protein